MLHVWASEILSGMIRKDLLNMPGKDGLSSCASVACHENNMSQMATSPKKMWSHMEQI